MFDECLIRNRRFAPARFCAPLVGYTHSAFRRLLAELGGCGAMWTEMLAARQILSEDFLKSPWLRRHPNTTTVFYQLMINASDPVDQVLGRLEEAGVDAIDLNLGCSSRAARSCVAGSSLFADIGALSLALQKVRSCWPHLLSVKIRLGHERPDWQSRFVDRLRLLEDSGVDAVVLHARFAEEKYGRRARHEFFPWAASLTKVPLIANGDLTNPDTIRQNPGNFSSVSGIMLGRIAIACPWVFSTWSKPAAVDLASIWERMYHYVSEDFPPSQALRRLQMFTRYFATNFKFGHQFNVDLGRASSLQDMQQRARDFFSRNPVTMATPTVIG